jgi:hypothetical protein
LCAAVWLDMFEFRGEECGGAIILAHTPPGVPTPSMCRVLLPVHMALLLFALCSLDDPSGPIHWFDLDSAALALLCIVAALSGVQCPSG